MINCNDKFIKELKKKKSVPEELFNQIVFTISNNEQRAKGLFLKRFAVLSPIVTSLAVFVFLISFSVMNSRIQNNMEFLFDATSSDYYDQYFMNIDDDFLNTY